MIRDITESIVVITMAVWLIWTLWAAGMPPSKDTVSRVLRDYMNAEPFWGLLGGVLIGHWGIAHWRLFPASEAILVALGAAYWLVAGFNNIPKGPKVTAIATVSGVILGSLLWPQT